MSAMAESAMDHLLITEVALANNNRELIEIYNPGATSVDLSNYYLSDDQEYALLPGAFGGSPKPQIHPSFDFVVKFPDGASIGSGEAVVVALRYLSIQSAVGVVPDFGILETSGATQMVDPSTLPGADGDITLTGSNVQLTNSGEGVVLFFWDGASDLVQDVDMIAVGDNLATYNQLADKTGVLVDGPDSDSVSTGYQDDGFSFNQIVGDAASGTSHKRIAREEGFESQDGAGNGLFGDDETTEDFASTWDSGSYSAPTPGVVPAALAPELCGNGAIDGGEECDDSGESTLCDSDCTAAECGDGTLNATAGEACDDGNMDDSDGCVGSCVLAVCGDGLVQAGVEECDDGNGDNGDGCLDTCVSAVCGDGFVYVGVEECDDGNGDDSDGCVDGCMNAVCGDGLVYVGVEECDDGGESATCDVDCTPAVCGDGVVNGTVGEQCDDGGESDECNADCTPASCGDGLLNPSAGEECDDGNTDDTDACVGSCLNAICGDGFVHAGVEECDDGNGSDGDFCTTICEDADCFDGIHNADEIDVDCGGGCGAGSCDPGQFCASDSECVTGDCVAGVCQAKGGPGQRSLSYLCADR